MKRLFMKQIKTIFLMIFIPLSLSANDFDTSFNYFGNLTASSLNKDGFNTKGYQIDDVQNHFQISSYSKVGIQGMVYNDKFIFVAQTVTHYKESKIKADLTWLNMKYKMKDNFNIRIGRMQSSMFLNSDVRDINYINSWGLEPSSFYTIMPVRFYNGVELSYNKVVGDYYINLNLTPYGEITTDFDDMIKGSVLSMTKINSISLAISNNNLKFKIVCGRVNIDMPIYETSYMGMIKTLQEEGNDVSKYNYNNKKISFLTVGLEYNYKNYSFTTEIARRKSYSLFPDTIGYYTLMSYRYDKFTPFVMYSANQNDKSHFDTSSINDYTNTAKSELDMFLYRTNNSQKTISLGFRYDLMVGVAFKAQIDKITIIDYGADYSDTVKRLGYTQRDAGIDDNHVYQATIGISFAF